MTKKVIEIEQLTRRFGPTTAVDDLSFSVSAGEVVGFIGPNGAGKTTTMKILSTLDTPCQGHAWVDGFSVVDDPDRVRRRLGYMPDGFGTYPNVTCEEYLDFFARSYGLRGDKRRKSLLHVMQFTQLDWLAQKPVDGLSKGMKQRLCLGRALIHDPSVLILDEPAAGLDPRARIELREMIVSLAREGKALLISSHILTELAEMCDRVAIIEKGRLLAVGSVEEILRGRRQVSEEIADETVPDTVSDIAISMTFVERVEEAVEFLAGLEQITNIEPVGRTVEFRCINDEEVRASILSQIVSQGFQVSQFQIKQKSLEDAFLHVTKGVVQ